MSTILLMAGALTATGLISGAPAKIRFPYMPDNAVVGCPVTEVGRGEFGTPSPKLKAAPRSVTASRGNDWIRDVSDRFGEPSAILDAEGCYSDSMVVVYADDPSSVDPVLLANVDEGPRMPNCDGTPAEARDDAVHVGMSIPQPTGQAYYVILSGPSSAGRTERIVHVDWTSMARRRSAMLTSRDCPRIHG